MTEPHHPACQHHAGEPCTCAEQEPVFISLLDRGELRTVQVWPLPDDDEQRRAVVEWVDETR